MQFIKPKASYLYGPLYISSSFLVENLKKVSYIYNHSHTHLDLIVVLDCHTASLLTFCIGSVHFSLESSRRYERDNAYYRGFLRS